MNSIITDNLNTEQAIYYYLFKPLYLHETDSSYLGIRWSVKNIFELKHANRVVYEGNVLEKNWIAADQSGTAIVLTPRN